LPRSSDEGRVAGKSRFFEMLIRHLSAALRPHCRMLKTVFQGAYPLLSFKTPSIARQNANEELLSPYGTPALTYLL